MSVTPLRLLELVSRVAPLGVRFRDDVSGKLVDRDLRVRAFPREFPEAVSWARPNRSGTWVFQDLPSLRGQEFGAGDGPYWASVRRKDFVVQVDDAEGRFLPFSFQAQLPFEGLFWLDCASPPSSPPAPPDRLVPLFSAPARQAPTTLACIRADLWDDAGGGPAPFAVLEVAVGSAPPALGVADASGFAVVYLPMPSPADDASASASDLPEVKPLGQQEWPVRARVRYARRGAPGYPDLCETLAQPEAQILIAPGVPAPVFDSTLRYGRELVLLTPSQSPHRLSIR